MTEVKQEIKLHGSLTTIENIQDVETLRAMYKKLNESYAQSQSRADGLDDSLRALRETLDNLVNQSFLAHVVRDLQGVLDNHIDATESLATALQAQEVQIHNLAQRLETLELGSKCTK